VDHGVAVNDDDFLRWFCEFYVGGVERCCVVCDEGCQMQDTHFSWLVNTFDEGRASVGNFQV